MKDTYSIKEQREKHSLFLFLNQQPLLSIDMDDTNQPIATVSSKPTSRYERVDKVTLKNGELRIVLRKDNSIKYDPSTGIFTTTNNDRWYNYDDEEYGILLQKLESQGFVEVQ